MIDREKEYQEIGEHLAAMKIMRIILDAEKYESQEIHKFAMEICDKIYDTFKMGGKYL